MRSSSFKGLSAFEAQHQHRWGVGRTHQAPAGREVIHRNAIPGFETLPDPQSACLRSAFDWISNFARLADSVSSDSGGVTRPKTAVTCRRCHHLCRYLRQASTSRFQQPLLYRPSSKPNRRVLKKIWPLILGHPSKARVSASALISE